MSQTECIYVYLLLVFHVSKIAVKDLVVGRVQRNALIPHSSFFAIFHLSGMLEKKKVCFANLGAGDEIYSNTVCHISSSWGLVLLENIHISRMRYPRSKLHKQYKK